MPGLHLPGLHLPSLAVALWQPRLAFAGVGLEVAHLAQSFLHVSHVMWFQRFGRMEGLGQMWLVSFVSFELHSNNTENFIWFCL